MSGLQNIYDNPTFFEGYRALRADGACYNDLLEQPALNALLPDLCGKSILELGCGWGSACKRYAELGAAEVVGVDLSENMIAAARRESADARIAYHVMDMAGIRALGQRFDVAVSSLAVHYLPDFDALARAVYDCLTPGGVFLFSQEHPIVTAPLAGADADTRDAQGCVCRFALSDYGRPGLRNDHWFVDDVERYHRPLSAVLNALIGAGFIIEHVEEPLPSEEAVAKNPRLRGEFHRPCYLIVRARRSA